MNNHQGTPKVYRRGAFALLMLIVINLAMIALGVVRYPQFWLQPGARAFVAEPVCVLVAYAIVVIWIARTQGAYWDGILRAAAIFGVLTGALEIINIGIENGVPFSVHGPALQIRLHAQRLHIMGIRRISNSTLTEFDPRRLTCSGFERRHLHAHRGGCWIPYSILPDCT